MLQWIVPAGKKTTIDEIWKRLIEIGVQSKVYLQTGTTTHGWQHCLFS